MSCTNPSYHYLILNLSGPDTGKKKLLFGMNGYSDLPSLPTFNESQEEIAKKSMFFDMFVKDKIYKNDVTGFEYKPIDLLQIPCGHCVDCQKRRSRDWIIRIIKEKQSMEKSFPNLQSYFLTFTYSDDFVPHSETTNMLTLRKKDLTTMFNNVKNVLNIRSSAFKYFACGEYGSKSMRPHYHAIVLSAVPIDWKRFWKFGFISCDSVTSESIGYVTRYVDKKLEDHLTKKDYERLGIEPIFNIMSKKLGDSFTDEFLEKLPTDVIGYDAQRYSIAKYYKKKLKSSDEARYLEYQNKLIETFKVEFARLSYEINIQSKSIEEINDEKNRKDSKKKSALRRDQL